MLSFHRIQDTAGRVAGLQGGELFLLDGSWVRVQRRLLRDRCARACICRFMADALVLNSSLWVPNCSSVCSPKSAGPASLTLATLSFPTATSFLLGTCLPASACSGGVSSKDTQTRAPAGASRGARECRSRLGISLGSVSPKIHSALNLAVRR